MADDRRWAAMTTTEAARLADLDPVVVLPVAAIEQHGPHLPLSTDLDIGVGVLEHALARLAAGVAVRVLPAIPVGASLEHTRFAGTLSVDSELLANVVHAVGLGVAKASVKRLVVFNSHGGNRCAIERAALRLRHDCGMLVVMASYFDFPRPPDSGLPEVEWRHGLHGGAVETSMMLHLKPDLVRMTAFGRHASFAGELEGTMRHLGADTFVAFAWLAGDLHPSGATGDATLATAEIGRRLVEHFGGVLAAVIEDARVFPLDRLT